MRYIYYLKNQTLNMVLNKEYLLFKNQTLNMSLNEKHILLKKKSDIKYSRKHSATSLKICSLLN